MTSQHSANLYALYAQNFPASDSVLLTTQDGASYTYADAEQYSAQVANYLLGMGLQAGDRVTVQVEKSAENLWLFLGVIRAGLIYHPLNSAYTDDELRFFLADARPSLVVCDGEREAAITSLCAEAEVPHLALLNGDGTGDLMPAVSACSQQFETAHSQPFDVAALVYSSGTTGQPKGIMLSHGNLGSNATVLRDLWGFHQNDCLLHMLPIFHVHGLFVALGCILMSGASMRWHQGFDVDAALQALPNCTVMMGVPTYYTRLLSCAKFDAAVCRNMRLFICGSAPLLPETFNAFEARTGRTILERYGMTETGMNISNPLNGPRKAGSVGLPLPGVEIKLCGADGECVPPGEVGDILVRGPNVFVGYWNQPEKTMADFTSEGFFMTGDKGSVDADGYISIVGRSKDMVITGGLNVYPRELELIIDEMAGVTESAVIGLPDADFGEKVIAVVVADGSVPLDEFSIRNAVRAHAAAFKVPKQVYFVEELPRNTMGKVRKDLLRSSFAPSSGS